MIASSDERIAAVELEHLARSLRPPCQAGAYALTGHLARTATALLYTARGPVFGGREGVLKLTGCMYAPILRRELSLLASCADAEIEGVVRPLVRDLLWLSIGGPAADRPAAAIALPLLSGGDLTVIAARAGQSGKLGSRLALQAARPIAVALSGMQKLLDPALAHGDLRPQNVLLPTPTSDISEVQVIDLDAAREVPSSPDAAREDVHGFGSLLCLLSTGNAECAPETRNGGFDVFVRNCLDGHYDEMRAESLWRDLQRAEDEQRALEEDGTSFSARQVLRQMRRLIRR